MKKWIERFLLFVSYLYRAKYYKGHGVHSPFAFDLITNVFEGKSEFYSFSKIENIRTKMLGNKDRVFVEDFGTGGSKQREISKIARVSVKKKAQSQLLFKLVNYSKPKVIFELGTSLGITTSYLASVDSKSICYSFEGSSALIDVAKENVQLLGLSNINFIKGDIDKTLELILAKKDKLDFVFFDANHTKEATLRYFRACLNQISEKAVFVFDDIHLSKGMFEAWKEIVKNPKVRVSFELLSMGIVYFSPHLQKQDYVYFNCEL